MSIDTNAGQGLVVAGSGVLISSVQWLGNSEVAAGLVGTVLIVLGGLMTASKMLSRHRGQVERDRAAAMLRTTRAECRAAELYARSARKVAEDNLAAAKAKAALRQVEGPG